MQAAGSSDPASPPVASARSLGGIKGRMVGDGGVVPSQDGGGSAPAPVAATAAPAVAEALPQAAVAVAATEAPSQQLKVRWLPSLFD